MAEKDINLKQVLKRFPPGDRWTPNRNKINMVGFTPDKKNVNPFMRQDNDPAKYNDTV